MSILADLRFAIRLLSCSPVLTVVAALSLGLGIAANTLIFSLVNEVFLRPLPLDEPDRLVSLFTSDERNRDSQLGSFLPTSRLNFEDYRQKSAVFESIAAHAGAALSTTGGTGDQALWAPRMGALLLASIGVYGVMAYAVSQRTREIGIRLALAATGAEVRGMVFRQGVALTAVGIVVGVAAAIGASRLVASLLFNTSPLDAVTFTVIPIVLIAVAGLAVNVPARRASRVDPVIALRST